MQMEDLKLGVKVVDEMFPCDVGEVAEYNVQDECSDAFGTRVRFSTHSYVYNEHNVRYLSKI